MASFLSGLMALILLTAAAASPPATAPAARAARAAREASDPAVLVRPGLLASRAERTVRIWATATGIDPAEPVEFLLIPQGSGKDYEALFISLAAPADVREALRFIGSEPGRPVDPAHHRHWPRGPRIAMHVEWTPPPPAATAPATAPAEPATAPAPAAATQRVRAEKLLWDHRRNQTLPEAGFIFTGSFHLPSAQGPPLLAAEVLDSRAIVADYNERASLLDVPRQARQGQVYGSLRANPAYPFQPGQAVQIVFSPLNTPGPRDLTLHLAFPAPEHQARFDLIDDQAQPLERQADLPHLLARFAELTDAGVEPFITLSIDPAAPLGPVRHTLALLQSLDREGGIHIDAPPPGHLYYRAFFPDPRWRNRAERLGKPWELHLAEKNGQLAGILILPADEIDDNAGQGELQFPITTADQLAAILKDKSGKFSQSVYIFAPASIRHGELMKLIAPALQTNPAMWIFLPDP